MDKLTEELKEIREAVALKFLDRIIIRLEIIIILIGIIISLNILRA